MISNNVTMRRKCRPRPTAAEVCVLPLSPRGPRIIFYAVMRCWISCARMKKRPSSDAPFALEWYGSSRSPSSVKLDPKGQGCLLDEETSYCKSVLWKGFNPLLPLADCPSLLSFSGCKTCSQQHLSWHQVTFKISWTFIHWSTSMPLISDSFGSLFLHPCINYMFGCILEILLHRKPSEVHLRSERTFKPRILWRTRVILFLSEMSKEAGPEQRFCCRTEMDQW